MPRHLKKLYKTIESIEIYLEKNLENGVFAIFLIYKTWIFMKTSTLFDNLMKEKVLNRK
ncbi:MAG: hypothetical protein LBR15_03265 [Methanobrevibacter sp.]|nr:hypothetical protein [Candidatus Methanovirga australis]